MANKRPEEIMQIQLCKYIDLQYPNVIYTSDLSGIKLSIGSGKKASKMRCKRYKIPDLLIFYPNNYHKGLFLELKAEKSKVWLKNGEMSKDTRVVAQNKTLEELKRLGYKAMFIWSFEHGKREIDHYINNIIPF